MVRARKANEHGASVDNPRSEWLPAVELLLDRPMLSERQADEWGMRAIKSIFGRLTPL